MCSLDSVEFNSKGYGKDCLLMVGDLQIPFEDQMLNIAKINA